MTASRADRMHALLTSAFAPETLAVIDESAAHAGHAGASPAGETHYRVRMQARTLSGLTRVERHRRVNAALAAEFAAGLHALSLEIEA